MMTMTTFYLDHLKMLTPEELSWCVRDDEIYSAEKADDYSEMFETVIRQNWINICTLILINAHLVVNQFNFRFAHMRLEENTKDFWPKILRQCPVLISFAKSALHHYFRSQSLSVYVNFSFALGVIDDKLGPRFLYSSRSNFQGLTTSYLIRNDHTFNRFFDDILPNFSLEDHLETLLTVLDMKYDGYLLPLSITFNLTRNFGIIYGQKRKNAKKFQSNNNCFFEALSCIYGIRHGNIYRLKKQRNTKNAQRAKFLKNAFKKFMLKKHSDVEEPFDESFGLKSEMVDYVEEFLKAKICIFSLKRKTAQKVSVRTKKLEQIIFKGNTRNVKSLVAERCSTAHYSSIINLIADGNHILAPVSIGNYMKHFYCASCNFKFTRQSSLNQHICENNQRYRCERIFPMKTSMGKAYEENIHENGLKDDSGFVYVGIRKEEDVIRLKIDYFEGSAVNEFERGKTEGKFDCKFKTVSGCAEFLVTGLYEKCGDLLTKRLLSNISAIQNIEETMKKFEPSQQLYGNHCKILEFSEILRLKDDFEKHLKFITCYLACDGPDLVLMEQILKEIVLILVEKNGLDNVEIFHNKGKLCGAKSLMGRVHFVLLNLFSMTVISNDILANGFDIFKSVVGCFKTDFGLNITTVKTATEVGTKILSGTLKFCDRLKFLSPSKFLYTALSPTVRYGILGAKKLVFGKDLQYKTAVLMDLEKFYLSVLSNIKVWTGIGILYEKDECGVFRCKPNRKRHTYANIFLNFISEILPENCALHFAGQAGYELRGGKSSLCLDAVLFEDGVKRYIQIDGCLHHPHFVSTIDNDCINNDCHLHTDKQPKNHKSNCDVCRNAENIGSNCVKPVLFKFRSWENSDSRHPLKKERTYREIFEEQKQLEEKNFGAELNKLIRIRECTILRFFKKPVSEFCEKFDIKFKKDFGHLILGEALLKSAQEKYPLMRFHGKIKENALIELIKLGKVNGFLNCSVKMSQIGKELLSNLKPFSFKKDKKVENVYDFDEQCVATNLLRTLLCAKEVGLCVTKINWFYEFGEEKEEIFCSLKKKVMDSIERNGNENYTKLLKSCLNSAVGALGIRFNRFPYSALVKNTQMLSLNQMRGYVTASSLSPSHSIIHFMSSTSRVFNLSHIHCQVISEGRAVLLSIILNLKSFLKVDIFMANCDSLTIFYKDSIDFSVWDDLKSCLFIDFFLKDELSFDMISKYVDWKMRLFKRPSVCNSHLTHYANCLFYKRRFIPEVCCKDSLGIPNAFKLKIEIIANHGLMRSATHLSFCNLVNQDTIIKCSGKYNNVFKEVVDCDPSNLEELL